MHDKDLQQGGQPPQFLEDRVWAPRKFVIKDNDKAKNQAVEYKNIINKLNYLDFVGSLVEIHFNNGKTGEDFLVKCVPQPVEKDRLVYRILDDKFDEFDVVTFENIIIDDGKNLLVVPIKLVSREQNLLEFKLSGQGYYYRKRQSMRFDCRDVTAMILYNGIEVHGSLADFSTEGMRFYLNEPVDFDFKSDRKFYIRLSRNARLVYSGSGTYVRSCMSNNVKALVVKPDDFAESAAPYSKNKKRIRNPRSKLTPAPKIKFMHPFTEKPVKWEVLDIATSGFSVQDRKTDGFLLTGMIIPELSIIFASRVEIRCVAQVVYSRHYKKDEFRYGIKIMDMDVDSYCQFFDLVDNSYDRHANVNSLVDLDALWDFFFSSGFIYPQKYELIAPSKEDFKNTYRRLYKESREIFYNFTYEQNNKIFGHVSMIRAYPRLWMIHHLAAVPFNGKRLGKVVLNHILDFYDGLYRLPSIEMDYMTFFYRPTNSFTDYFFGGFCREMSNAKACSIDIFAYLSCPRGTGNSCGLPDGWELADIEVDDLQRLEDFYAEKSGGLLIDALHLNLPEEKELSLEKVYARYGFLRKTTLKVLRYAGNPVAVFIVDESDFGLNMSDFLNNIKVIVIDEDKLAREVLFAAIDKLNYIYPSDNVPVMVFPCGYLDKARIDYNRQYCMWIMHTDYGADYVEHMKRKAQMHNGRLLLGVFFDKIKKNRKADG